MGTHCFQAGPVCLFRGHNILVLLSVFLLLLIFPACKSSRSTAAGKPSADASVPKGVPEDFHLELERTACYGTCPIFVVKVSASGEVEYHGKRFVEHVGHFRKQLSDDTLQKLARRLQEADFFAYQALYDQEGGPTDFPSLIISYRADGRSHTVTGKHQVPKSFTQLAKDIEALIGDGGYEKVD